MKRIIIFIFLFIFIAISAFAESITVITKDNTIREYAKFFAPVKTNVKYNDRLEIIAQEGDWYKVRYGTIVGYIHKSAVEKRAAAQPASYQRRGSSLSESEAALAGKGFNPQVEASYKKEHPEMKFSLVDSIEHYPVPEREITAFIKTGGLQSP